MAIPTINTLKGSASKLLGKAKDAAMWYIRNTELIAAAERSSFATAALRGDRTRLIQTNQVTEQQIGRVLMYFYDPKLKATLPYYDVFPVNMLLKIYNDGILCANFHYLPPAMREDLLGTIYTVYKNAHLNENTKLQMSYDILKKASRNKYYKPCIKRYLWGHVRSKFYLVDPEDWNLIISLPLDRFRKADRAAIWADSQRIINKP